MTSAVGRVTGADHCPFVIDRCRRTVAATEGSKIRESPLAVAESPIGPAIQEVVPDDIARVVDTGRPASGRTECIDLPVAQDRGPAVAVAPGHLSPIVQRHGGGHTVLHGQVVQAPAGEQERVRGPVGSRRFADGVVVVVDRPDEAVAAAERPDARRHGKGGDISDAIRHIRIPVIDRNEASIVQGDSGIVFSADRRRCVVGRLASGRRRRRPERHCKHSLQTRLHHDGGSFVVVTCRRCRRMRRPCSCPDTWTTSVRANPTMTPSRNARANNVALTHTTLVAGNLQ